MYGTELRFSKEIWGKIGKVYCTAKCLRTNNYDYCSHYLSHGFCTFGTTGRWIVLTVPFRTSKWHRDWSSLSTSFYPLAVNPIHRNDSINAPWVVWNCNGNWPNSLGTFLWSRNHISFPKVGWGRRIGNEKVLEKYDVSSIKIAEEIACFFLVSSPNKYRAHLVIHLRFPGIIWKS